MNSRRILWASLSAAGVLAMLAMASACGISGMPTGDVWFTQHYIIMQDFERTAYRTLGEEGKSAFHDLFWSYRTPQARAAFEARMQYVMDNYKRENSRQPWNTDRGRIYILNGEPASVEIDQNVSWASTVSEGGMGVTAGAANRDREDLGANRAELWTYPYRENFIKYGFVFIPPNQWRMAQPPFEGNRFLGEFENYTKEVFFGVKDIDRYKEEIAALPKK
jgi:GWxTD domain-containing protein